MPKITQSTNTTMNKLITYFSEKPKTLFLIDSIGACMTAFSLFVIMRPFSAYLGMPATVLSYLSAIAICFGMYSMTCFLFLKTRTAPFIRLISIANILYCVLTTGLLINYAPSLSLLGTIYFSTEILIICLLSYIELRVAAKIKRRAN